MLGNIVGGALVGGVAGGAVAGLFVLIMKVLGKPIGKQAIPPHELPQTIPMPPTWRTETKRLFIGLIWFFVIWFLARVVIGGVVGGIAGEQAGSQAVSGTNQKETVFIASQTASVEFLQHYGLLVLLGSIVASITGTATGFLPGTKRPRINVESAIPSSETLWPPPPTGAA